MKTYRILPAALQRQSYIQHQDGILCRTSCRCRPDIIPQPDIIYPVAECLKSFSCISGILPLAAPKAACRDMLPDSLEPEGKYTAFPIPLSYWIAMPFSVAVTFLSAGAEIGKLYVSLPAIDNCPSGKFPRGGLWK